MPTVGIPARTAARSAVRTRPARHAPGPGTGGPVGGLHAWTWLVWAGSAAAAVQLAPNPLYVVLVLGLAWLVTETQAPPGPYRRAFPELVALGAAFATLRVVLTALTTHNGIDVWFTLPQLTLPRGLGGFALGGTVEGSVVLQTAAEGLVVVGIMGVFGAANACMSHAQLLASLPRAFHTLGLVTTVGVSFVPSTIASTRLVREADRARTGGRVVRRGRLVRLVVPVLERGLEQALALAESMEARGFAHRRAVRGERAASICGLAGLVALTGGFVALVGRAGTAAALLGAAGLGSVIAAVVFASRGSDRPRYRPRPLRAGDRWVMLLAVTGPVLLGALRVAGIGALDWAPNPVGWPPFHPLAAAALLPLAAPLLGGTVRNRVADR